MKKLLTTFLFFLLTALPSFTQQNSAQPGLLSPTPSFVTPDLLFPFQFSASGASPAFDNRKVGCTSYSIWYWNTQSQTTVSITPQFAPDNNGVAGAFSNWPAAQTVSPLPLTSLTESQDTFSGFHPWLRVNLATFVGGGTLNGFVSCYRQQGSQESTNAAPFSQPLPTAPADGTSNVSIPGFQSFDLNFNGTTWDRQAYCSTVAPVTINPTTATTTLLLSAVSAKTNRICTLEISDIGGATAQTVKLIAGTQTTNPCDTGAVTLSPTYQFPASATQLNLFMAGSVMPYVQGTTTNQQVCVVTSAAVSVFVTAHAVAY